MMKKMFLLLLVSSLFNVFATAQNKNLPIDEETYLITFTGVVNEPGTKTELYERGVQWASIYYVNAANVLKSTDNEKCVIEGSHRLQMFNVDAKTGKKTKGPLVEYKFKIEFRDGRFRYTFDNFINKDMPSRFPVERWMDKKETTYNSNWDGYLEQINEKMNQTVESLTRAMHPKPEKNDEW